MQLPPDLRWVDASRPRHMAHAAAGQPITLQSRPGIPAALPQQTRAQLDSLAAAPGCVMSLTIRGVMRPVVWARPIELFEERLTLRLIGL